MKVQGKETFQVVGDYELKDREFKVSISEEDIKTVVEQASVGEVDAKKELDGRYNILFNRAKETYKFFGAYALCVI